MFTPREAFVIGLICDWDDGDESDGESERTARGSFLLRWLKGKFYSLPTIVKSLILVLLLLALSLLCYFIGSYNNLHHSSSDVKSSMVKLSNFELGVCSFPINNITSNNERKDANEQPILTYVFLAGIEGSGHHAFLKLLTSENSNKNLSASILNLSETSNVHSASRDFWYSEDANRYLQLRDSFISSLTELNRNVLKSNRQLKRHRTTRATRMRSVTSSSSVSPPQRFIVGPVTVTGEPLSYPFGPARNAVVRPCLREMRYICLKANVKLVTLVLYRDPFAATFSRIHSQSKVLIHHELSQSKIVLDNLLTLSTELNSLPCEDVATVRYEELLSNPAEISKSIALFAKFDPLLLMSKQQQQVIVKPTTKMTLSSKTIAGIRAHLGYEEGETELSEAVIRSRGWWNIVAPELDVKRFSGSLRSKMAADLAARSALYCCHVQR